MPRVRLLAVLCVSLVACLHTGWAAENDAPVTPAEAQVLRSLFATQGDRSDPTNRYENAPTAAALGEKLFHEARLSGSRRISCASCHAAERNWTDGRATAKGASDGTRNTPMLWNVADRRWFFWDGRVATLWSQALHPIESPTEMGGRRDDVVRLVDGDPPLRSAYEAAFGRLPGAVKFPCETHDHKCSGAVNRVFANVGKALAAFEKTLVARSSPFDAFLECLADRAPDECRQLDRQALAGLRLFVGRASCVNCHHGRDLTDDEFHSIMLPDSSGRMDGDPGRMRGVAEAKRDEFGPGCEYSDAPTSGRAILVRSAVEGPHLANSFRTPSLRQVALTAPYMHNGIYPDLAAVLKHYSTLADAPVNGHHAEMLLVKLELTNDERDALLAFLRALSSVEGMRMGRRVPIQNP